MSNEHIPMTPSVGRVVHYTLTDSDAEQVNKRRNDARSSGIAATNSGAVVHIGNQPRKGDVVPLVIVRVWPDEYAGGARPGEYVSISEWVPFEVLGPEGVNGQAILDGNDSLWVTSASQGPNPGQWHRPPQVA